MKYDAIIIGAGLSGLAASIRLGHFGKKVLLLERHRQIGGLNSIYNRKGIVIDVGLHNITGFDPRSDKSRPLKKLVRYLRLDFDELRLVKQKYSKIILNDISLRFENSLDSLKESISRHFPPQIDNFNRLLVMIDSFDEDKLDNPKISAKQMVRKVISDERLLNLLFLPVLLYGSPEENDIDFTSFVIIFKSIFYEGLGRPEGGMTHIIDIIKRRLEESHVDVRLKESVAHIETKDNKATGVVTTAGQRFEADAILSSIGRFETMKLSDILKSENDPALKIEAGSISFMETIHILDKTPSMLGEDVSTIFYSNNDIFSYQVPDDYVDQSSGVISFPDNFDYSKDYAGDERKFARITNIASYNKWSTLERSNYRDMKKHYESKTINELARHSIDIKDHISYTDSFTPVTVEKFTGHINGAVYGSPYKQFDGLSLIPNLYYIGTDQGYLGIIGAMLSGVIMANKIL
ncbi:MAG: phytoene desaturase family protein [Nitrospinota bacterium]